MHTNAYKNLTTPRLNWGAANGGLRDGGSAYLRISEEKGPFPQFSGFPTRSSDPPEKGETGRKGRKSPISADFQEGWPARHPLNPHLLHPHLRQPNCTSFMCEAFTLVFESAIGALLDTP